MSNVVTELEDQRLVYLCRYSTASPNLFSDTPIEQYNTLSNWPGYSMYAASGDVQGFLTSCQISAPEYSKNYLELAGTSAPTDATRNPIYSTRELTFSVLIDLAPLRKSSWCMGQTSTYDRWVPSGLCERLLNASRNVFMKPYKWALKIPSVNAFYFGRCNSITSEVVGEARAIILTYSFTLEPWCYEPCSSYTWSKPATGSNFTWTFEGNFQSWFMIPDILDYTNQNTFLPALRINSPSQDLQVVIRFYQSSTECEELTGYVFAGETVEFTGSISAPYGYEYELETIGPGDACSVVIQGFLKGL